MLNWPLKINKLTHWLIKLTNSEATIGKKWEAYKQKIPPNKTLSMILSPAISEKLKNSKEEFTNLKVKWMTEKPKPISRSTSQDKISRAKSKPTKCSRQETTSFKNGVMNSKETWNQSEFLMSISCKIPILQEDKLSKSDSKWELNYKPLKTRKSNRSRTFLSLKRTDSRPIYWTKNINWERKRKKMLDYWPNTRNWRTRLESHRSSTEEQRNRANARRLWTHKFFSPKTSSMLSIHNDINDIKSLYFLYYGFGWNDIDKKYQNTHCLARYIDLAWETLRISFIG